MKWTSELPRQEGYYWYSPDLNPKRGKKSIYIQHVIDYNGTLSIYFGSSSTPMALYDYARTYMNLSEVWAGPILRPEE